jgi:hypothetical protein
LDMPTPILGVYFILKLLKKGLSCPNNNRGMTHPDEKHLIICQNTLFLGRIKQLSRYWRSRPPIFWQASLGIGNFNDCCPIARKLAVLFGLIVAFDRSTQLVALMSWVEGPFRAFWTLALKSDFTMPQLDFLRQNRWPWRPLGRYGANTHPMAAPSGI